MPPSPAPQPQGLSAIVHWRTLLGRSALAHSSSPSLPCSLLWLLSCLVSPVTPRHCIPLAASASIRISSLPCGALQSPFLQSSEASQSVMWSGSGAPGKSPDPLPLGVSAPQLGGLLLAIWILRCAYTYLVVAVISAKSLGESEVTDLGIMLVDQQDISGCQVPVDKVFFLQVLHPHGYLVH